MNVWPLGIGFGGHVLASFAHPTLATLALYFLADPFIKVTF